MIFLVYSDDYTDPIHLVGPFDSEEDALLAYIRSFRKAEPGEGTCGPGESDLDAARRIYLTDDSVRLGKVVAA